MARLSLFIYGMQTASPSPNSLFSPRVAGYGGGGGGAQITAKETFAASDGAAERELFPKRRSPPDRGGAANSL